MTAPDATGDDLIAAEYVLGLLDAPDAGAIERRAATDPALAAAIAGWSERFAEIDRNATPQAPSPELWRRIEQNLDAIPRHAAPAPQPGLGARLWRSLDLWRGLGIAATTAAVLALALPWRPGASPPVVVAVLQAPDGQQAGAIVEAKADGSITLIPLVDIAVPPGRTLQVWTLWDRGRGPVPLGLMPRAQRAHFETPGLPRPQPDQLYEITLEPAAGSPTGRPTGPILYKGLATRPL